jgi:hypothetical protein
MSTKTTRRLGMTVLLITVVLGGMLLPALFPGRDGSAASAKLLRTIQQVAIAHVIAGMLIGFGVTLLLWPFRNTNV